MTVIKLALLLAVSIVGYTRGAWPNPNPGTPGPSHFNPFTKPQWDAGGAGGLPRLLRVVAACINPWYSS